MKYRELGNTGIFVSEVGFGAWGIGGTKNGAIAYGKTDDKISSQALKKSIDLGINFFDTSPLYGLGNSESLIGNVIHTCRDKVVIATKVGYVNYAGDQDFSLDFIQNSLEKSLKRLKTTYIDVFQLHDPPKNIFHKKGIKALLQSFLNEGKVRSLGVSVRSPKDGLLVANGKLFSSIQVNYNLTDLRAKEIGLFKLCTENNIGVIIRTPLAFGFLTGKYNSANNFDIGDHRAKWSKDQIEKWSNAVLDVKRELKIKDSAQTDAQLALRFCLSEPAVSTIIPGMLTQTHVEENYLSSEMGPLSKMILNQFFEAYDENNKYFVGTDQKD